MYPIGIFDSGYGGLTILRQIREVLPQYDYIYLGDNARAPYGSRSYEVIYQYTLSAVEALFEKGCRLVILACNTASAKALRTIQQTDLQRWGKGYKVLGIIRPTTEIIGTLTTTQHVGLLATTGTVQSGSYALEIKKHFPSVQLTGVACPMWVPLVENNEFDTPGADYFVKKRIDALLALDNQIDTIILGCTHYPLLAAKIRQHTPPHIRIVEQGAYVAMALKDYLHRHEEIESGCSRGSSCRYLTTEHPDKFKEQATLFLRESIEVEHIELP